MAAIRTALFVAVSLVSLTLLTACSPTPQEQAATQRLLATTQARAQVALRTWSAREGGANDGTLRTTLLYDGGTADVLLSTKPQVHPDDDWASSDLLGRTAHGRYFYLRFGTNLEHPLECTGANLCGSFDSFRPLSEQEAQLWVFQNPQFTDVDFERIFGKKPPAHERPA